MDGQRSKAKDARTNPLVPILLSSGAWFAMLLYLLNATNNLSGTLVNGSNLTRGYGITTQAIPPKVLSLSEEFGSICFVRAGATTTERAPR